jgi:glucose-6-phosphate isomerase
MSELLLHAQKHPDIWLELGAYQEVVSQALQQLRSEWAVSRMWRRDPTLWSNDPAAVKEISHRLGWLNLHETMRSQVPALSAFAVDARAAGLRRAVHLGMGGSSLAPEVLREVLGVAPGYLDLVVLDSTDPAQIRRTAAAGTLTETLFIVASKSGTTAETSNLYGYFHHLVSSYLGADSAARHFCVITDPGTALEALACDEQLPFFINPANIGGRFSALSLFGLLPAALLGLDLTLLLDQARTMALACGPNHTADQNPGAQLGAVLGVLARLPGQPRDKLTLLTSPELDSFGAWVEQLVAESTGKNGVGILPVVGEKLPLAKYSPDRVVVYLRLESGDNDANDTLVNALAERGQPCVVLPVSEPYGLAGQFFLWEFATAIAGILLKINPFDQPNVEAAKIQARASLAGYESSHTLEVGTPALVQAPLTFYGPNYATNTTQGYLDAFLKAARQGDYLALMAYIDRNAENEAALQYIRQHLGDRLGLATTLGFGPRYLHSTGQLHKGGANNGLFVLLVQDEPDDLAIPGRSYSFGVLKHAQALGDLAALQGAGRRIICVNLGSDVGVGLRALAQVV